jgi:hypothetical protein
MIPLSPQIDMAIAVAIADIATLTRLFPSKIVPISRSGLSRTRSTSLALLGLVSARCLRRNLLRAIRAVSDPEKKAEKPKRTITKITMKNMFVFSMFSLSVMNGVVRYQKATKA